MLDDFDDDSLELNNISDEFYLQTVTIKTLILELLQTIANFIDGDFNELIVSIIKNIMPEYNKIFRLIEMQLKKVA